jgi:hypothetical protein
MTTTELIKKETRTRGGIKADQTASWRVLMNDFKDTEPRYSITGYNRLFDHKDRVIARQGRCIEKLEEKNEFLERENDRTYHMFVTSSRRVDHLIGICERLKKERIPDLQYIKNDKDDINCSICLDTVSIGAPVYRTPCGHVFDAHCWLLHSLHNKDNKCPNCRTNINP